MSRPQPIKDVKRNVKEELSNNMMSLEEFEELGNMKSEYSGLGKRKLLALVQNGQEGENEDEEQEQDEEQDELEEDEEEEQEEGEEGEEEGEEDAGINVKVENEEVNQKVESRNSAKSIDLIPEPNDPNHYCRVCDFKFSSKKLYENHLRDQHEMQPNILQTNLDISPNMEDPNNYCLSCDIHFRNKDAFRIHLIDRHNMNVIRFPDRLPDWRDPNYYCPACDITFDSDHDFHIHCRANHRITASGLINDRENGKDNAQVVGNARFYCGSCQVTLPSKQRYQSHLLTAHPRNDIGTSVSDVNNGSNSQNQPEQSIRVSRENPPFINNAQLPVAQSSNDTNTRTLEVTNGPTFHEQPQHAVTLPMETPPAEGHAQFNCGSCQMTFPSEQSYQRHIHATHTNDNNDANGTNGTNGTNDTNDTNGTNGTNGTNDTNDTNDINGTNGTSDTNGTNVPVVHNLDPNYCLICDMAFGSKLDYTSHMRVSHARKSHFCLICKRKSRDKETYVKHCKQNHGMLPPPTNSFCFECNKVFTSFSPYCAHLRTIHPGRKPEVTIPDLNNRNYHCSVCQERSSTQRSFFKHCQERHRVYPAFYCDTCDLRFKNQDQIERHVLAVHKRREMPDINDTNFYCRACEEYSKTHKLFRIHCHVKHGIILPKEYAPALQDPNNACHLCERSFCSDIAYKGHVFAVHLRATTNKSIVPEVHNPDFYCRSCEQTYENQRVYRLHLRLQHEMNIKLVAYRRRIRLSRKRMSEQATNSSTPEIDSADSVANSSDPGIAPSDAPSSQTSGGSTNINSTEPDLARSNQPKKLEIFKRTRSQHGNSVQPWNDTTRVVIDSHGILSQPASRRSVKETAIVNPFAKIDVNHPDNYCVKCDVYFITKPHFDSHIKTRHNIKPPPQHLASSETSDLDDLPCRKRAKVVVDSGIEIDMSHPEFYCAKCGKNSSSEATFRTHLKGVHGLITEIRPPRCNINPDAEIDINHPEFYCAKCDKNLSKKSSFMHHLRMIHGLLDEGLQPPYNIYPDAEVDMRHPEFYCAKCDRKSATKANFCFHLKNVHDLFLPQESKGNILFPDAEINVNHPEFYCSQCHIKFLSKITFRAHLRKTHGVKVKHSSVIYPNAVVDINDPNFHCTKCDKYLKNNKSFRSHLSKKHRMVGLRRERAKPSKMIVYPDAEIDPNHPQSYCAQCDRSFLCKSSFDDHLRKIHDFDIKTPKERAIPYPDAEIDMNHPESYCAKCDRYLKPSSFRKHLAHFHQIVPKDQKGFIRNLRNGREFQTCYY